MVYYTDQLINLRVRLKLVFNLGNFNTKTKLGIMTPHFFSKNRTGWNYMYFIENSKVRPLFEFEILSHPVAVANYLLKISDDWKQREVTLESKIVSRSEGCSA
jgi:hypothetical protein